MSLVVYTHKEDIPSSIKYESNNDLFFDQTPLTDDDICKRILSVIDKAKYLDENKFTLEEEGYGEINKENLSTGCKTLLNILNNPDKCFNVIECGQNALKLLSEFTEGNILWETPILFLLDDLDCDIISDNKKFTKLNDFLSYYMDRED